MTDLEKAAAQAEKENKDLFIVYRGGAPEIRRHTACRNGRSSKSAWQGAI